MPRKRQHRGAPNTLRVRVYTVLAECVEQGIACGWRRAHKHIDAPTPDSLQAHIYEDVISAISERFEFPDDGEG